jgi:hypothetical protein
MLFAPGRVAESSVAAQNTAVLQAAPALPAAQAQLQAIQASGPSDTPESRQALRDALNTVRDALIEQDRLRVLYFALLSDTSTENTAQATQVKAYHDSPRILLASTTLIDNSTISAIFDLLHNPIRVLPYPGQATTASMSFRSLRGMNDTMLESAVMEETTGQTVITTASILQEARRVGVPLVAIDSKTLDRLADLSISSEAKARITRAVNQGRLVVVPEQMLTVAGKTTIGWWDVDYRTGDLVGVGEDGTHQAAVEYGFRLAWILSLEATVFAILRGLMAWLAVNLIYIAFVLLAVVVGVYGPDIIRWALERTKEAIPGLIAAGAVIAFAFEGPEQER